MSDEILSSPPGEQIRLVINKMTDEQYQRLSEISADQLSTTLSNELFLTYGAGDSGGGGGYSAVQYLDYDSAIISTFILSSPKSYPSIAGECAHWIGDVSAEGIVTAPFDGVFTSYLSAGPLFNPVYGHGFVNNGPLSSGIIRVKTADGAQIMTWHMPIDVFYPADQFVFQPNTFLPAKKNQQFIVYASVKNYNYDFGAAAHISTLNLFAQFIPYVTQ